MGAMAMKAEIYHYWADNGGWRLMVVYRVGTKYIHGLDLGTLAKVVIDRRDYEKRVGLREPIGVDSKRLLQKLNQKVKRLKGYGVKVPTRAVEQVRESLSQAS
jgi:hypothetical protein